MVAWLKNVIGTPVECLRVPTEAAYREKVLAIQKGYGLAPVITETGEHPAAYVDQGRWLVECACGNGCLAHPGGVDGWPRPIAICTECGNVYEPVFPKERADLEIVLLAHPNPLKRNFAPDDVGAKAHGLDKAETLGSLAAEAVRLKLPIPDRLARKASKDGA